ncbi:hypothetical protein PMI15_02394 [Polaromonas sp. CF318]|uniref:hypothetical protein n=1 Tax=Polaromonas sp. CF318 TaxID=1144318 RepID=UPI000270DB3B|nr:hypothetical protein [Polaromonas sp. CF318]EJL83978.1 hypothetical protein PMI15_02394 [Polaromonas sp. CF318]
MCNPVTQLSLVMVLSSLANFCLANTPQVGGYESEAQRLEQVRRLIKEELKPRPADSNDRYRQANSPAPKCSVMLQDLIAGKFKAIEPVQIRVREDILNTGKAESPSRTVDPLRGFPKHSTEKLNFCASSEAAEKFKGIEGRFFFGFSLMDGAPPYRVYKLSNAINPYSNSDFVYWSSPDLPQDKGWQYTWIDLGACKPVFKPSTSYSTNQEKERPGGNAQALTLYSGKFTYVEAHKKSDFLIEYFEPGSIRSGVGGRRQICRWNTFPEPSTNK